jgi:hypothetical protein
MCSKVKLAVLTFITLAVCGALMRTNAAHRRAQIMRGVSERVEGTDRFVDVGIIIKTVVADPNGDELIEGKPRLKVIAQVARGGMADTSATPPRIVGPSHNPRVWYVSEQQATALFHKDRSQLGQLIYGSEGAGKTRLLGMWHALMWLSHFGEGREGGQTAPTETRLEFVREEMFQLFPGNWFRYRSADKRFVMCDGTRIQLVSTYRQSKAQGSPVQGFNWSWAGRDEAQDSIDVHEDIQSRGRSARDGQYWQMATATAKDDSEWRDLRDVLLASGKWVKRNLSIFRSPFVPANFIADTKASTSAREFLRRFGDPITGEVGDLPPELAVYYGWLRSRNLAHRPRIATDVTAAILASYRSYCRPGAGFSILCSHDPGAIFNTTEIMRLLVYPYNERDSAGRPTTRLVPTWAVVGELQTSQTTAREHALLLKRKLQDEFGIEYDATQGNPMPSGGKACIFVDPHGKGEAQTDYQSVYMAFQGVGLDVFNPAPMVARIQRAARIEMVNRLLSGTTDSDIPRLVVLNDGGVTAAPKLVEAFEELKKSPGDKNPEGARRKDESDKTHAPAALAYGLWPFEQEAFTGETIRRAIAEAQKLGRFG